MKAGEKLSGGAKMAKRRHEKASRRGAEVAISGAALGGI